MRANIKIWGEKYKLESLYWGKFDRVEHVTFLDKSGGFHTVFDNKHIGEDTTETYKGDGDLLYTDLSKIIIWEAVSDATSDDHSNRENRLPIQSQA